MIALLSGSPIIHGENLIVDVNGVGYEVLVSASTLRSLLGKQAASLHIKTIVREESLELFGFVDQDQKSIFSLLLNVSGVGPRTALQLSDMGASELTRAVQEADVATFTKTPRVGKKLAQKIIIELKSKLGSLRELQLGEVTDPQQREVAEALQALGFAEQEVLLVLPQLDITQSSGEQIKQAMRLITSK